MFWVSKKKHKELQETVRLIHDTMIESLEDVERTEERLILLRDALDDIIKQQTKAANATVSRMIKIAKDALAHDDAIYTDES